VEILYGLFDVETIVTVVWVPIIINYFSAFLEDRNKSKKLMPYLAWGGFWIVDYLLLQKIDQFLLKAIILLISWTLIGFCLYVSSLKTAFLIAASLYCIGNISEFIVALGFVATDVVPEDMVLRGWIISKLIILIFIQIVKFNRKGAMKGEVKGMYWMMSVLIPIGSMIIAYTLKELTFRSEQPYLLAMSSCAIIIVLFMNIFIFRIYDKMQQEAAISRENSMYEQQAKMFKQQCDERETVLLESRKLFHDFKNHLIILKGFSGKGQYEKVDQYVGTLMDNYTIPYWQTKSGNMVIDSLLSYKTSFAGKSLVSINSEFSITDNMPFEDYDLCIIVGNVLDNAIEAVEKIEKEKRKIEMLMKFSKNVLTMRISNPYIGDIKTDRYGKLLTIKPDKINHGMGMRAIEKTVKKYSGSVTIEKEDGLFHLMIIMYGKGGN
jgi:sensor histidine kinase YesM